MHHGIRQFIVFMITGLALIAGISIPSERSSETAASADNGTLLFNARVFDTSTGRMSAETSILIEGDRIKAVGKLEDLPGGIKRIDCTGKFVLPGFFDSHTHLAFLTASPTGPSGGDMAEKYLKHFVTSGITQVRDLGGPLETMRKMTEKTKSGEILGPEIFYAGPMLEKSPLFWERNNKMLPGFTVAINTKEDVDRLIPELAGNGACMVKTFNKMDPEVYRHLVFFAKENNLKVVHDPGTPLFNMIPMDKAIDFGITSIEHGKAPWPAVLTDELQEKHDRMLAENASQEAKNALSDEIFAAGTQAVSMDKLRKLIKTMVDKDVCCCPTLLAPVMIAKQPLPKEMSEEEQARYKKTIDTLVQMSDFFTGEMIRGGVKILVGQDGINPSGLFSEMRLLKDCGLAEAEIIKGATIYPAQWLGIEDRLGSISPGKQANIVVLDHNPLDDIDNVKSTFLVLKQGKEVFRKSD